MQQCVLKGCIGTEQAHMIYHKLLKYALFEQMSSLLLTPNFMHRYLSLV